MQTLTQQVIDQGYSDRVLSDAQLARLLRGSPQRRYGLVNRALKAGELLRIQRGLYLLANQYRRNPVHPFSVAQALHPGSYVSFETALAWHGWIPEAVYITASVIRGGRFRNFAHESLGQYTFTPLATSQSHHLELVEHIRISEQAMLIAKPIRALMDLVYNRKVAWQGLDWLEHSLRIDRERLAAVTANELATLKSVYRHKRMQRFLACFEQALDATPYTPDSGSVS